LTELNSGQLDDLGEDFPPPVFGENTTIKSGMYSLPRAYLLNNVVLCSDVSHYSHWLLGLLGTGHGNILHQIAQMVHEAACWLS
jgi:hypothetical protein